MKQLQRSRSQVFLLILSLVGAGIAIYLTFVHYENAPLVCSESGLINCAHVLSSSYAVVPGTSLPITIPGLGWCLVSFVLAIFGLYAGAGPQQRRIYVAQFAWSLLGLLSVLYLVYVEIVRLRTICAWCTGFHVLVLLMFLVTLVQLQSQTSVLEFEPDTEGEEEAAASTLPQSK
jgi:uncharacterized membrane protein